MHLKVHVFPVRSLTNTGKEGEHESLITFPAQAQAI